MEGIKPEISAPGVGIRSSYNNGGYATAQGTSMAAPHVSGAAALLLSANANLDVDELQQVLIDTAIPLTDPAYPEWPNYGYGYGLVDALAAINSLSTIYGDLDGSGSVNVVDAVMVLRHAASLLSLTPEQAAAADANGDGYVNIADAIIVLRYIAGLVGELPYRP
jgi:bacillopeptidase F